MGRLYLLVSPPPSTHTHSQSSPVLLFSQAAAAPSSDARMALACVLDVSGSMVGPRLKLAGQTCHFLIDQMRGGDYSCFVTYSAKV